MVTLILKCNSINNSLIISTGIGNFEFSHSLGHKETDAIFTEWLVNLI